jgi:hypothetical protein
MGIGLFLGERIIHTTLELPTVIMITSEQYHLYLRIQAGADRLLRK